MNHRTVRTNWLGVVGLALLAGSVAFGQAAPPAAATTRPAQAAGAVARKPHDPGQWEKEIAAMEAKERENPVKPGGVAFVGSSTIRIWDLKAAFPNANVSNRGFGGSWTVDSVVFAERLIKPVMPKTIIYYEGDNDIAGGTPAEEVAQHFEEFVHKAREIVPDVKIVVLGIKPSVLRWKLWPEMYKADALRRKFVEGTPNMVFVPVARDMMNENGGPRPELLRKDGLHMSEEGYKMWNEKVRPFVEGTK